MVFACRHATDVLRLPVLVLRHGCALVFCHAERTFLVIANAVRNPIWMRRVVQHDKVRIANLTLLSLSLQKEKDVLAKAKTG